MCIPITIPTKYYPFALMILFTIISDNLRFDLVVAGGVGLFHYRILNAWYNELLSERNIAALETGPFGAFIKVQPCKRTYYVSEN